MKPECVVESVLYATDLAAAEGFYTRIFQLDIIARETGRHVFFRCGSGVLLVFNPAHTSSEKTYVNGGLIPLHGASGAGHLAFRAEEEKLPAWRDHLCAAGVPIESEVSWPQGGRSIYFRDPAGNSIELVTPEVWDLA
ncbi:MAG: VOC family protein [Opitutaceae bacterium]